MLKVVSFEGTVLRPDLLRYGYERSAGGWLALKTELEVSVRNCRESCMRQLMDLYWPVMKRESSMSKLAED